MNKPNITEGKWCEKYPSVYADNKLVASVHVPNDTGTTGFSDKCNAKAISAVPEMIDALIEAKKYINTKREIFKKKYPNQEPGNINKKLDIIKEALKKAGCE